MYISGADQSASAPETPQRPLSYQDSGQQQRVQVRVIGHIMWLNVFGFGPGVSTKWYLWHKMMHHVVSHPCECVFYMCVVLERSGSGCRPSALWRSHWKWTMMYRVLHIASYRICAVPSRTWWPTSMSLAIRSERAQGQKNKNKSNCVTSSKSVIWFYSENTHICVEWFTMEAVAAPPKLYSRAPQAGSSRSSKQWKWFQWVASQFWLDH